MKILFQWNAFRSLGGLGCCPFLGGGSVVFINCLMYFSLCVGILCLSLFCLVLLCVHSNFAIVLKRKRTLCALLLMSYQCLGSVNVLCLFLTVPWDGPVCSVWLWYPLTILTFIASMSMLIWRSSNKVQFWRLRLAWPPEQSRNNCLNTKTNTLKYV